MIKRVIFSVILFISTVSVGAQVSVSASLDSIALFIGEQTKLTLQVNQPADRFVQFPFCSDTVVSGLEIVSSLAVDTQRLDDGSIQVQNSYLLTSFDSAVIYIPPFEFVDGEDTLLSNSLSLKIVDMPVDTTQQAIADIKGVYSPPFNWAYFWTVFSIIFFSVALIALIAWLIYRYMKNRGEVVEEEEVYVDPRTAYQIAIEDLSDLQEQKLWQSEKYKLYYTQLTDIVRTYIKRRFAIGALEQSTEELLTEYKDMKLPKEQSKSMTLLRDMLQISDLVKFAKWVPVAEDNVRIFEQAKEFVELTKITEEEVAEKQEDTIIEN
ncbi:MAG: hypothetical protein R3Y59_00105 [bacterium]